MPAREGPRESLARSLASERIHSAYLFTGPGEEPRELKAVEGGVLFDKPVK